MRAVRSHSQVLGRLLVTCSHNAEPIAAMALTHERGRVFGSVPAEVKASYLPRDINRSTMRFSKAGPAVVLREMLPKSLNTQYYYQQ